MTQEKSDFVIVGSGGGGATIAWLLAKAGHSVTLLEQGPDIAEEQFKDDANNAGPGFNSGPHDEYYFRWKRPDTKRRPRGDYNTFRLHGQAKAKPFKNGWTGSILGGGSTIWGTWAFRALPVDLLLGSAFAKLEMSEMLTQWGYSVADWPIRYQDINPFYEVAETLLAVSGDNAGWNAGIAASPWYAELIQQSWFSEMFPAADWNRTPFPCPPYPLTPVGAVAKHWMNSAGYTPLSLPSAIVSPGTDPYRTRQKLQQAVAAMNLSGVWRQDDLWSERVRQACNMCGYCGEFLCWGGARPVDGLALIPGAPKSGSHSTVLQELKDMEKSGKPVKVICNARAYEVIFDEKQKRAKGVHFLNVTNPDEPACDKVEGEYVILSCGAVQTARLLWMSGPRYGLGNSSDQLGRNACFHLFGMSMTATFKDTVSGDKLSQGLLHGEFGHTGNVTSFDPYFVKAKIGEKGRWLKGGTLTSTAKKNPLENALDKTERGVGRDLLKLVDQYERTFEIRLTADDLPMPANRVDLDPTYVDEYGFPVARITRKVGQHEWRMFEAVKPRMEALFTPFKGNLESSKVTPHVADLIGDHQMGTCRMGEDPGQSVVNQWCRLHDAENIFVVDSSFMPTGLGLNPMVSVVANALRVGTHIIEEIRKGRKPGQAE